MPPTCKTPARTIVEALYETLTSDHYRAVLGLILALAALLILTGIGLRSPWPADEPRFVEVAREMVDFGQWLIPMRGGEPYPDKPPVFMWSIAFFYWLTGSLKVGFLLPNALCGLLTVYLVFDIAARLWNVRVARNAALLLLLAPQFIIQAKVAQIDAMVACWITVGCYGLLRHFLLGPSWSWYFTGWAFMGLGIITKGVGFLPMLMLLPIAWLAWRNKAMFKGRLTPLCLAGPLVMLLVAALWLVPMVLYVDYQGTELLTQYRDNILFKQTAERYADSWGHIQPWYYFLIEVIPALWFPLPLILLAGFAAVRQKIRTDPAVLLLFVWVALVVLFFSLSPGKRGVYILPALPMFAVALSASVTGHQPGRWLSPVLTGIQVLLGGALISIGILAWHDHPRLVDKVSDYSRDLSLLHQAGSFLIVVGLIWFAAVLGLWRQKAVIRLFAALSVTWLLYSTWGYSLLEPLRTPRNILQNAEALVADKPGAELAIIDFKEQYILFSKLDITHFSYFSSQQEQARNAWLWMQAGQHRYLMAEQGGALDCFDVDQGKPLGVAHRDRWVLLSVEQMKPACLPPKQQLNFHTPQPGRWMGP